MTDDPEILPEDDETDDENEATDEEPTVEEPVEAPPAEGEPVVVDERKLDAAPENR